MSNIIRYIIFVVFLLIQISVYAKHIDFNCSKPGDKSFLLGQMSDTGLIQSYLSEKIKRKKWRHYKRGDTLYYCDVLQLRNHNYKEHLFAVFGFAHINARRSRSKLKIKYILGRETNYLSTIFYTKAVLIERKRVDIGYQLYMKMLEKKYPSIMMWGVLDANAIANVITRQ